MTDQDIRAEQIEELPEDHPNTEGQIETPEDAEAQRLMEEGAQEVERVSGRWGSAQRGMGKRQGRRR